MRTTEQPRIAGSLLQVLARDFAETFLSPFIAEPKFEGKESHHHRPCVIIKDVLKYPGRGVFG